MSSKEIEPPRTYDAIPEPEFQLYYRRWLVILSAAFLNVSNGVLQNTFAPVADKTQIYYHISFGKVNLLPMVFMLSTILVGVPAAWTIDTLGLKSALVFAALCNFVGAGLRFLSVMEFITLDDKFTVLIIGQCIAGCAQPFIMFSPPKIAQHWFPPYQRSVANSIASLSSPLGIGLAAVMSPAIMNTPDDMFILQIVCFSIASVALLYILFSVRSSRPPTPPSSSAMLESETFIDGLKLIAGNGSYWLLCFVGGGGLAMFACISSLLEQMLCTKDYTDIFSGVALATLIVVGLFGAVLFGVIVGRTGLFIEVAKVCSLLAVFSICMFSIVVVQPHQHALVLVTLGFFGLFGMGMFPILLELAVECTYPVSEGTSAGVLIMVGQVLALIIIITMQILSKEVVATYTACHFSEGFLPLDFTNSMYFFTGLAVFGTIAFVTFFTTDYKRLDAEKQKTLPVGDIVKSSDGVDSKEVVISVSYNPQSDAVAF